MFLDERINAEQGRAFRLTVIFAWALTVLYGIFHFVFLKMAGELSFFALSVEIFCAIGGGVLVGIGELSQWSDTKDEMWEYEQNKFYSKAFYIFLYIMLFAYCSIRVPAYIARSPYDMPPNQLLIILELTGLIVLITKFKFSEVPLNYTFISEERKGYGKRVLLNIGKLGGIIMLFTSLSLVTLIFIGEINALDLLSILLSGVVTWISFSTTYTLFSVAEWLSDRAKEKNRISVSTLFFFFAAAAFALGTATIGLYCSVDNGHHIVTSQYAVMISSLMRYFALMETALFAVFTAYLYSEMRFLKLEKFKLAVKIFVIATVLEITVSELMRVISSAVMSVENENIRGIYTILGYTNQFISIVFTILTAVVIYICAKELFAKEMIRKWCVVIPILNIAQSVGFFVWKIVFQSWAATIGDYLVIFFFMTVYIIWMIKGAMAIKKTEARE